MDIGMLLKPQTKLDPFPLYSRMRQELPVVYFDAYDIWSLFRFEDVRRALSDHALFTSRLSPQADERALSMLTVDPPRHTKLRQLVSRAFTPRTVELLTGQIEALTADLVESIVERGQADVIADLAEPLPVMVIASLLGIPVEDRARFKEWSDVVVASSDNMLAPEGEEVDSGQGAAMAEMQSYFLGVIEERTREPKDDLVSHLIASEIEGERLNPAEILAFCWLLLVAGNETTTNLIGNTVLTLLEHPEAIRDLRADPSLIPSAIEEVLRYRSPIQAMFRRAKKDIELGGTTIGEGQYIAAMIGSANRDPDAFPSADTFDIRRKPNGHIAFGFGVHYCLGAPLARLEGRIALGALLARLDAWERGPEPLEPQRGFIIHGVTHLPLTFRPAS